MKKKLLFSTILTVCLVFAGYGPFVNAAEKSPKKETAKSAEPAKKEATAKKETGGQNAAVVNGKNIPMSEYNEAMEQLNRQIAMTGRTPDEKEMTQIKQKILDNLVTRELLLQEIQKKSIKADDAEVNMQIENIKGNTTPEQFASTLKQMNLTEKSLREHFASQLAMKKLLDAEVASKITVTPEEIKKFYDDNPDVFKTPEMLRASHILVKVEQTASPEEKTKASEKIKEVQKKLKGGTDFAALAKEVSDCPSKENGGDLNFFSKGQMVEPFEKAAFAMKTGETSDVVETEFGYHIILVTEKKDAGTYSFDEMKSRIEQHLKNEKISQEFPKYVEQLKSKAKIQILAKP